MCLLIDDLVAIDAGGVTSNLSISAQQKLKAILLTHEHYDHIRDVPMIALALYSEGSNINVYCRPVVRDMIETHLLNGKLYPKFHELPAAKPTIEFISIEPYEHKQIENYDVLAIPVSHNDTAVGYQVTDTKGNVMFYTTDTGPGLTDCWRNISPQLLITDVTAPNRYEEFAINTGHLTPRLLNQELIGFQEIKGYLPQIFIVHMDPVLEGEIEIEIAAVAKALGASITLAHEGMQLSLEHSRDNPQLVFASQL